MSTVIFICGHTYFTFCYRLRLLIKHLNDILIFKIPVVIYFLLIFRILQFYLFIKFSFFPFCKKNDFSFTFFFYCIKKANKSPTFPESSPTRGNTGNECCHDVLPSTARLGFCRLMPVASLIESMHLILGLPLFLPPSSFPSTTGFSRQSCLLMMCLRLDLVLSFMPPVCFSFNLL